MTLSVDIEKKLPGFHLCVKFETQDEILALLGPSGSGKSMTLKCIAGLEKPDRGRIVLNGRTLFDSEQKINVPPQKRRVGYLFQNYALFPNMSALQNVMAGCPRSSKEEAEEMLHTFHLENRKHHRPHMLSGGEQQRVALARILMSRPELLLLDEPLSALDAHLKRSMQQELITILRSYPAVFVSHDFEESRQLCSCVCILSGGKCTEKTPFEMLISSPKNLTEARISGCRNIFSAKKIDKSLLHLPQLDITLSTDHPIAEDTNFACIRGENICFSDEKGICCRVLQKEEHPFYTSVLLQFKNQLISADFPVFPYDSGDNLNIFFPPEYLIPLSGDP